MAVAVVAGGSAGLGRAVVRELADDGWDVAVLARGEERLGETVDEVRSRGRRAMWISADVADGEAVEEAAARIEAELGRIELWVNGPLAAVHAEFLDVDPRDFERITDVTYHGTVNGMVFQPEVGARVIARVARHPRPRTWVGEPSVAVILGNRVVGGLLDRLAAKYGYRWQQAPDVTEPMLPGNLDAPVAADVAARGIFGDRSLRMSPQLWVVLHRGAASAIAAGVAAVTVAGALAGTRRRR